MSTSKRAVSATENWVNLLHSALYYGAHAGPRDMGTSELIANKTITDMSNPIVKVGPRKISYPFMFAEAWHILSGRNDVESLEAYSPSIGRFSDDGSTFAGAYGPRVVSQMNYVIESLLKDPESRQAAMTIYSPNPEPSKDIPCTLSLQFLIRNGAIDCVTTMRSSDVWIGYIYDVFNFSAISAYVMLELNKTESFAEYPLTLGRLHLTGGSQHLYDDKKERAMRILEDVTTRKPGTFCAAPINFEELVDKCDDGAELIMLLGELKDHTYETN